MTNLSTMRRIGISCDGIEGNSEDYVGNGS